MRIVIITITLYSYVTFRENMPCRQILMFALWQMMALFGWQLCSVLVLFWYNMWAIACREKTKQWWLLNQAVVWHYWAREMLEINWIELPSQENTAINPRGTFSSTLTSQFSAARAKEEGFADCFFFFMTCCILVSTIWGLMFGMYGGQWNTRTC